MPRPQITRRPAPSKTDESRVMRACGVLLTMLQQGSQQDWHREYVEHLAESLDRMRGTVARDRAAIARGPDLDRKALHDAVEDLIVAEVTDSWKGGGDPNDIPAIERDRNAARARYTAIMGPQFTIEFEDD